MKRGKKILVFIMRTIVVIMFCFFACNVNANPNANRNYHPALSMQSVRNLAAKEMGACSVAVELIKKGDFERAKKSAHLSCPHVQKLAQWTFFRQADADVTFQEITAFILKNPDWPQQKLLRQRAEEAITLQTPFEVLLKWFHRFKPITAVGHFYYIFSQERSGVPLNQLAPQIKKAWVEQDFGKKDEVTFYERYKNYLSLKDHAARADRLLWEERIDAAKRMKKHLDHAHDNLVDARIALIEKKPGVDGAVKRVAGFLQNHPGLLYDRIKWHRKKETDDAPDLFLKLSPHINVYPNLLWFERKAMGKFILNEQNNPQKAYKIIANHKMSKGTEFVDAEFLAGWIALRFLKDPHRASLHFKRMLKIAKAPISLSRSHYWLARSLEAQNQFNVAQNEYAAASKFITTYYGQLSATKLGKKMPSMHALSIKAGDPQLNSQILIAGYILGKTKRHDLLKGFVDIEHLSESQQRQVLLFVEATEPRLMVGVARKIASKQTLLVPQAYPIRKDLFPEIKEIEHALAFAIMRQESNFDTDAQSSAGAQGLMQLMPKTAQRIAKKYRVSGGGKNLKKHPHMNVRIGTLYLKDLLNEFGHYVLAIASYNAGENAVRRWIKMFGDPREKNVDVVDWIERITYPETNNYVMRVLEGVQIYRLSLGDPHPLRLSKDLKH